MLGAAWAWHPDSPGAFLLLILLPQAIAEAPDTLRNAQRSLETDVNLLHSGGGETTQDT